MARPKKYVRHVDHNKPGAGRPAILGEDSARVMIRLPRVQLDKLERLRKKEKPARLQSEYIRGIIAVYLELYK